MKHRTTESPEMILEGQVVKGHQVASGKNLNPLFPGGTLAMQTPVFRKLGLDLSQFHPATVNVSIAPRDYKIISADVVFQDVAWHPTEPPEDFSFVKIEARLTSDAAWTRGLIYYPHPETKPAHHQPAGLLELLLESFIRELNYGSEIQIRVPENKIILS